MTAYLTGTSTEKADDLIRAFGGVIRDLQVHGVEDLCAARRRSRRLRDRTLDHIEFPYVFVDATYLNGRKDHRVARRTASTPPSVFLEGLAMAQEMGQLAEMAGELISIAEAPVVTGMVEVAIAILSGVVADPGSRRSLLAETVPVGEVPRQRLEQLTGRVDPLSPAGGGGGRGREEHRGP